MNEVTNQKFLGVESSKIRKRNRINDLEIIGGFEAGEIDEVDGARAGHDINGEGEDEEGEETEDGGEVVPGVPPKLLPQLFPAQTPHLGAENQHQDRDGRQVNPMVDQIMIPQFHILQIDRLNEVRQPPPDSDGECLRSGVRAGGLYPPVDDLGG